MFANLTGWHLLIILAVVLLLFGAAKLPALAKSVGQSTRIFRSEMRTLRDETRNDDEKARGDSEGSTAPAADSHPGA